MMKRLFTILLTLVIFMGLAAPAMAAEADSNIVCGERYTVAPTGDDGFARFHFTPDTSGWYWFCSSGVQEKWIWGSISYPSNNIFSSELIKEDETDQNFYVTGYLHAGKVYWLEASRAETPYSVSVSKASQPVTSITLDYPPPCLTPDASWPITPSFKPAFADPGNLTVTSSNPSVAYVKLLGNGEYYLCLEAPGTAVIRFIAENGVQAQLPVTVMPEFVGDDLVTYGNCGNRNNMVWELRDSGLVTIFGEGETIDGWAPWEECSDLITQVALSEKTTAINDDFFAGTTALTGVTVPASVRKLGFSAFGNSGIRSICFLGDAPEMEELALANISATIYYPEDASGWDAIIDKKIDGPSITWVSYPSRAPRTLKKVDGVFQLYIGDIHVPMSTLVAHYGSWYYVQDGKLASDFTGFVPHIGSRYYVKDGKVLSGTTGFVEQGGVQYYILRGRLADKIGLVRHNGELYYIRFGMAATDVNTLVKYNGEWFYVRNGKVDSDYTGFVPFNGFDYYVQKGKVLTGLVKLEGVWYYYVNGRPSTATTLVKHNGEWFYVRNGVVASDVTTLVKFNGSWFYVKNGKVASKTTTLVKWNGEWFYIKNGKVDIAAKKLINHYGGWYYVLDGRVAFKTTTLVYHRCTWYYVKNGSIDWNYEGPFRFNGGTYQIKNGKVVE